MAAIRRYRTIDDTRKALAAFLRKLEAGTIDVNLGRALIHGCSVMASIQRDSQIEERLDTLEAALANEGDS